MHESISIIIPALNEEGTIAGPLRAIASSCPDCQVIVSDGASTDRTPGLASEMGAMVVKSPRGRAAQMNAGARAASGDVLMFLHADCLPPEGFHGMALQALKAPGVVAGAFDIKINHRGMGLRAIERMANMRSRITGVPYGDQCLFMPARVFQDLGGFREIPLMEDIEIARRLRQRGKIGFIGAPVLTSPRRWLGRGLMRTTALNWALATAYTVFGVSPERLARYYRDVR